MRNASISLDAADRIALTGPNGSGKTTVFRVLVGLLVPTKGGVFLDGDEVREKVQWRNLRRQVGMVFQDPDDQLFCPTLLDDVAFGPLNMGMTRKEARKVSMAVLESLGLAGKAEYPPYALSGGQKKLASLATVLSMSPGFLLLDEPSAGLDPEAVQRLVEALGSFEGGFLVSSHDTDFLRSVSSFGVRIVDGGITGAERLSAVDPPRWRRNTDRDTRRPGSRPTERW